MKDNDSTKHNIEEIGNRLLPDTLITNDDQQVSTWEQWEQQRRPEILELFKEHVFGRESIGRPASLSFTTVVTPGMMAGKAIRKQVEISYEGAGGKGTIRLLLFVPSDAGKRVPVFVLINNRGPEHMDPERITKSPFWSAEMIVDHGYAAAVFDNADVDPDYHDGFLNGVHGIFDSYGNKRPTNAWGTIAAWAWGACRVMDYLETDTSIDSSKVALVGHSRGGKTALWAGALDERFAMVVSNNSGCTGAALSRGKIGETIKQINDRFPHWFNDNYKGFNDRESELPLDQHMLLSLIAPRPLYITSATEDEWADPVSEFLSLMHASPVYRLYGLEGYGTQQFPQADTPIFSERTGYHVRTGVHDLTDYDWSRFIDFANRQFKE
jgi:pimeloyl-ACP methyl ester carboxylesterase